MRQLKRKAVMLTIIATMFISMPVYADEVMRLPEEEIDLCETESPDQETEAETADLIEEDSSGQAKAEERQTAIEQTQVTTEQIQIKAEEAEAEKKAPELTQEQTEEETEAQKEDSELTQAQTEEETEAQEEDPELTQAQTEEETEAQREDSELTKAQTEKDEAEQMQKVAPQEGGAAETAADSAAATGEAKQTKLEVIDFDGKGYGDSQMMSSRGSNLLIDTYVKESWNTLNAWLSSHNYFNFDIYISHYHDDHMDNVTRILNSGKYTVSKLYLPDMDYMNGTTDYMKNYISMCKSMIDTAKKKGVQIISLKKNATFSFGDVVAEVLWGTDYNSSNHDASYINNNSLVTRFTCGNTRYLNAGDIEAPVEKQLLSAKVDVRADIFKLNHHGGKTSNTKEFLEAVNASFYYYNYCGDTPSVYAPLSSDTWAKYGAQNAKQYGNVASVRYNGDITYEVYDDVVTQKLERNYTTQKVCLYDKEDPDQVKGIVTQQFNKASRTVSDERAYGDYDYSTYVKEGTNPEGWIFGNGGTQYYYSGGAPITKWQKLDGKWHFFDSNGAMQSGWVKSNGKYYLLDSDGSMVTGWGKVNNKWYYLEPSGVMHRGWLKDQGRYYYFKADGQMSKGWLKNNGKWYYFNNNGSMATGWTKVNNKWYYLNSLGALHTGWFKDQGRYYYFAADGHMSKGWLKNNGKWYYFNSNGSMATGWIRFKNNWYYLETSGVMHTGWLKTDDRWYYFDNAGHMVTGSVKVGGKTYYFRSNGSLSV